jgi:folate-binding Fe-S cluster repair protein YgfZ
MASGDPSPLHDTLAAGAVLGEREGRTVVVSYGDADAEYAAALEGTGLIDLTERGVLEASGPKRQDFLQGMLSNDVGGRRPGQGCRAAMTTAKGRIQFLLRVLVEKDVVRLETEAVRLAQLQRTLEHYRVAAPVRFAAPPTSVLGVLGLGAADVLRDRGVDPPLAPEDHARATLAGHDVLVARAGDLPGGGFALHAAPEEAVGVWNALADAGARPVGRDVLDTRRVEDLRPWYGVDVTEENLLHETGLLAEYHSPTKGCYVGQEVVAGRGAGGGHGNNTHRRLPLSAPAAPGTTVRGGDKDVGRLTTVGVSPRFGPVALGWVHRSQFDPGTELDVDGSPATVVSAFDEE